MTTLSAMPAPGTVVRFLTELRATGTPVIRLRGGGAPGSGSADALLFIEAEADSAPEIGYLLADWHRETAEDLGGLPLAFDAAAARHGVRLLFRAAWCYLQRGISRGEVGHLLGLPPGGSAGRTPTLASGENVAILPSRGSALSPQSIPSRASMLPVLPTPAAAAAVADFTTAAAQFSADLTLRHLPAVFRMARTLAPGDPLLPALLALAARFPLSGAGLDAGGGLSARFAPAVPLVASPHQAESHLLPPAIELPPPADPAALENLLAHAGLRQLFLDRILTSRSRDWLRHPQIAEALHQTLGSHAQTLSPGFLPATVP